MSYKRTMRGVSYLIQNEYDMAAENNGETFASLHEGTSVIQEEAEEAIAEFEAIGRDFRLLWERVKEDDAKAARLHAEDMAADAERLACEAIQIAAMALKFADTVEGMEADDDR